MEAITTIIFFIILFALFGHAIQRDPKPPVNEELDQFFIDRASNQPLRDRIAAIQAKHKARQLANKPTSSQPSAESIFSPTESNEPVRYVNQFMSAEEKVTYLKSAYWYTLKQERLVIANHCCEVCGSINQLNLHHQVYSRLGWDDIDDVRIVCGGSNGCHQAIHDITGYDRIDAHELSVLTK